MMPVVLNYVQNSLSFASENSCLLSDFRLLSRMPAAPLSTSFVPSSLAAIEPVFRLPLIIHTHRGAQLYLFLEAQPTRLEYLDVYIRPRFLSGVGDTLRCQMQSTIVPLLKFLQPKHPSSWIQDFRVSARCARITQRRKPSLTAYPHGLDRLRTYVRLFPLPTAVCLRVQNRTEQNACHYGTDYRTQSKRFPRRFPARPLYNEVAFAHHRHEPREALTGNPATLRGTLSFARREMRK